MCVNKEVSFIIALFGLFCAIKQFNNESIAVGLYILCLVLMQLNEFFLHIYNNPNTTAHQIAAFCIPLTIMIQSIYFIYTSETFIKDISPENSKSITIMSSIFLIIMIYIIISCLIPAFIHKKFNTTMICDNHSYCRLKWDSLDIFDKYIKNKIISNIIIIILMICFVVPCIMVTKYVFNDIIAGVLLALLISLILFNFYIGKNLFVVGSLWCLLTLVIICFTIITATP